MRSMCFALGEPRVTTRHLTQVLQRANYHHGSYEFNLECIRASEGRASRCWCPLEPSITNNLLNHLLEIENNNKERLTEADRSFLKKARSWHSAYLGHTGRDGIAPKPGEVRSIVLADVPLPWSRLTECARELQDLGVRAKSTARANTRRDAVVMQQVADRLTVDHSSLEDLLSLAAEALNVAVNVTSSSGGAIYFLSAEPGAGYERTTCFDNGDIVYPNRIANDESTALAWSVSRHRATQVPPGAPGKQQKMRTFDPQRGTELITPIMGPLAGPNSPAVGALSVFRDSSESVYSGYDLSLLRNIALRLALLRTTGATARIADAITAMRTQAGHVQLADTSVAASALGGSALPRDIAAAVERFREPLEQLAHSTNSHSVTVRIALPSAETSASHGLALVRVAAYPRSRMTEDPYPAQQESDGGINWIVMRNGAPEYVRRARGDERVLAFRPGTASELCVPVRVEGALIGVLNLESTVIENYTVALPLILAFSAALGRTLADAAAAQTQRIIDRAALTMSKRHDIDNYLTEFERSILRHGPNERLRADFETFSERVRGALAEIRQPPSTPAVSEMSLSEILDKALVDLDMITELPETRDSDLLNRRLNAQDGQALSLAFRNVFRNLINHTAPTMAASDGHPLRSIYFSNTVLDGRRQSVVIIENYSDEYISTDRAMELYRYPLVGNSGELRLGAFLAGLNARRAGAKLHASVLTDARTLRTIAVVPI
ncbi:MAG: GAF domain-containing protein [Egibacteraceae bacterium]